MSAAEAKKLDKNVKLKACNSRSIWNAMLTDQIT